jgi:hypothetical protein
MDCMHREFLLSVRRVFSFLSGVDLRPRTFNLCLVCDGETSAFRKGTSSLADDGGRRAARLLSMRIAPNSSARKGQNVSGGFQPQECAFGILPLLFIQFSKNLLQLWRSPSLRAGVNRLVERRRPRLRHAHPGDHVAIAAIGPLCGPLPLLP